MKGRERDLDEFGEIASLFRPLTGGAAEALGLQDDAALLTLPPGHELVVTTDTLVAGVHFLANTPYDLVARKLLRVNLSDLAAKAAEPWGWFLNVAWPSAASGADRETFAAGLGQDQRAFGLRLFGGDTVRTPGPLTVSATLMGLAPTGETVRRGGARAGDALRLTGPVGDAGLGLALLQGRERPWAGAEAAAEALVARHQLPRPRLDLRAALRRHACAAADVSDGLLADALHVAQASGLGVEIRLEAVPVSAPAAEWLAGQPNEAAARLALATSGDDYELVLASADPQAPGAPIGHFVAEPGLRVTFEGVDVTPAKLGWSHV